MKVGDIIEFRDMNCKLCAFYQLYGLDMCTVEINSLRYGIPKVILEEIVEGREKRSDLQKTHDIISKDIDTCLLFED